MTGTHWLAMLPDLPGEDLDAATIATATARDLDDGASGLLAAWATDFRPHPQARRVDPRAVDPHGPGSALSLVWPAAGQCPLFDDPAVVQAVRLVSFVPHLTTMSTLTDDPVHFAGSLLAADAALVAGWPGWWAVDPFARLASRRRLLVGPGLLAARVAVLGPGTQRRAGAPWPAEW